MTGEVYRGRHTQATPDDRTATPPLAWYLGTSAYFPFLPQIIFSREFPFTQTSSSSSSSRFLSVLPRTSSQVVEFLGQIDYSSLIRTVLILIGWSTIPCSSFAHLPCKLPALFLPSPPQPSHHDESTTTYEQSNSYITMGICIYYSELITPAILGQSLYFERTSLIPEQVLPQLMRWDTTLQTKSYDALKSKGNSKHLMLPSLRRGGDDFKTQIGIPHSEVIMLILSLLSFSLV